MRDRSLGSRRGFAALMAAALLAVLLSSCGGNGIGSKSARTILLDSSKALAAAKSYRLSGSVPVGGKLSSLTFTVGGPGRGEGDFAEGSLSFELEEVGGVDYLKSSSLWKEVGGGVLAPLLSGRWVSIAASNPLAGQLTQSVTELTSPAKLAAELTAKDQGARKDGPRTFARQGVEAVSDPGVGTVLVATSGHPYPLQISASGRGSLTISDFGARFAIHPPAKSVSLVKVMQDLGG